MAFPWSISVTSDHHQFFKKLCKRLDSASCVLLKVQYGPRLRIWKAKEWEVAGQLTYRAWLIMKAISGSTFSNYLHQILTNLFCIGNLVRLNWFEKLSNVWDYQSSLPRDCGDLQFFEWLRRLKCCIDIWLSIVQETEAQCTTNKIRKNNSRCCVVIRRKSFLRVGAVEEIFQEELFTATSRHLRESRVNQIDYCLRCTGGGQTVIEAAQGSRGQLWNPDLNDRLSCEAVLTALTLRISKVSGADVQKNCRIDEGYKRKMKMHWILIPCSQFNS
jgi:hypothetical protein